MRRPRNSSGLWLWASLLGLLALSCDSIDPHPEPPPVEAGQIEHRGCDAVRVGRVCEVWSATEITVWSAAPSEVPVGARFDREPWPIRTARYVEGGVQAVVALPSDDGILTIEIGTARARLRILHTTPHAALAEARTLTDSGARDEAYAVLADALEDGMPPVDDARARGDLARRAIDLGRIDEGLALLPDALHRAHQLGLASDAASLSLRLFHTLAYPGKDFTSAREVLDSTDELVAASPTHRVSQAYFRALVAMRRLDLRRALDGFERARQMARRVRHDALAFAAAQGQAELLEKIGRLPEAIELLYRARAELPLPSCSALSARNTIARLLRQRGDLEAARAQSDEVFDRLQGCGTVGLLAWAHLTRTWIELAAGDLDAAHFHLNTLRDHQTWTAALVDTRLEVAIRTGALERALELAVELEDGSATDPGVALRAVAARGRILAALGRGDEAERAYERAMTLIDELAVLVPLGEGRGRWLAAQHSTVAAYVELLLGDGRVREAYEVARRERRRLVADIVAVARVSGLEGAARRALEAAVGRYREERAKLSEAIAEARRRGRTGAAPRDFAADAHALRRELERAQAAVLGTRRSESPPPRPAGELTVLYFPVHAGWVAFAELDGAVQFTPVGARVPEAARHSGGTRVGGALPSDPDALAKMLLDPVADDLGRADRLRVLAFGAVRSVDVHGLPWRGEPLLATLPVVYGLDIGGQQPPRRDAVALVVADPLGDLPHAAIEGRRVRERLARSRRAVLLSGAPRIGLGPPADGVPAVHRENLLEGLEAASHLHYVGHGRALGLDGLGSELPLDGGARIDVADILTAASVPRSVVLAGCETAKTPSDALVETLGLAQAFLARGSAVALASSRPVRDDDAMAGLLYGAGTHATDDLATAARDAMLAWHRTHPDADWTAWRVLVP